MSKQNLSKLLKLKTFTVKETNIDLRKLTNKEMLWPAKPVHGEHDLISSAYSYMLEKSCFGFAEVLLKRYTMKRETEQKGSVVTWSRDHLEDQYIRLYDDYIVLKKHCVKQEDRIKLMATRLMRLASDRKTNLESAAIEEYKQQIEIQERKNASLRQKPIRPSRGTSATPLRTAASAMKSPGRNQISGALQTARMQNSALEETIRQLSKKSKEQEDTIGRLREELLEKHNVHEREIQNMMQQLTSKQRKTVNESIEAIRQQREEQEKDLKIKSLEMQLQDLQRANASLQATNRQLVLEVDRLARDAGLLESKLVHLETSAGTVSSDQLKMLELKLACDDAKRENEVLKASNAKLMNQAFSGAKEALWLQREQQLRSRIVQLENVLQSHVNKQNNPPVDSGSLATAMDRALQAEATVAALKTQIKLLQAGNSVISPVQVTRVTSEQAGVNFRRPVEKAIEKGNESELLQRLKESEMSHSETIQELEKTRRLLAVQYRINKDCKAETNTLADRLAEVREESDQRLKEYAKLLDIRASRIRCLERRLDSMAYGDKVEQYRKTMDYDGDEETQGFDAVDNEEDFSLTEGKNIIEMHVGRLVFTSSVVNELRSAESPEAVLRFFLTWDFFDFETQATQLMDMEDTDLSLTVQYPVHMDDFLLAYLQKNGCTIELHLVVNGRHRTIAAGQIDMSSLLNTSEGDEIQLDRENATTRRTGNLALFGAKGSAETGSGLPIGKLEYWIRFRATATEAIKLYKQRFKNIHPNPPTKRIRTRTEAENDPGLLGRTRPLDIDQSLNELEVVVASVSNLQARRSDSLPSPYVVYRFYDQAEHVSPIKEGTNNAALNDVHRIFVRQTQKLDSYLRTQNLIIFVMDSSDPEPAVSCLGVASVPLLALAKEGRIAGPFELYPIGRLKCKGKKGRSPHLEVDVPISAGQSCGLIDLQISWAYSYDFGKVVQAPEAQPVPGSPGTKSPSRITKSPRRSRPAPSSDANNQIVAVTDAKSNESDNILQVVNRNPEPPKPRPRGTSTSPKLAQAQELIDVMVEQSDTTAMFDDENCVRVQLHKIELYSLPKLGPKVFIEYFFLGSVEPFETRTCELVEKSQDSKTLYAGELNYEEVFHIDLLRHGRQRQELISLLKPVHPDKGKVVFTLVSDPDASQPTAECQEIGSVSVDLANWTSTGAQPESIWFPVAMAACIAVVSDTNQLLYLRTADCPDPLFYHFKVHAALDVIEDKLAKRVAISGGTSADALAASVTPCDAQLAEQYLGLLYPMEDHRLYGYVTNTHIKFIIVQESNSPISTSSSTGGASPPGSPTSTPAMSQQTMQQFREAEIRGFFNLVHSAYVDLVSCPFYTPRSPIQPDRLAAAARFDSRIAELLVPPKTGVMVSAAAPASTAPSDIAKSATQVGSPATAVVL